MARPLCLAHLLVFPCMNLNAQRGFRFSGGRLTLPTGDTDFADDEPEQEVVFYEELFLLRVGSARADDRNSENYPIQLHHMFMGRPAVVVSLMNIRCGGGKRRCNPVHASF
jgi:hypothetical protein